jgi:hypothetical protein
MKMLLHDMIAQVYGTRSSLRVVKINNEILVTIGSSDKVELITERNRPSATQ